MYRTILTLAFVALAAPSFANAVISEFPAGGVVFKEAADISIVREDLRISLERIDVHYDYRSDAAGTQHVTIGFPMPPVPIDGGPDDPSNMPELEGLDLANYMLFSASVGGEPVETTLHQFAWHDGVNITNELTAAGIPVFLHYEQIEAVFAKVEPKIVDHLVARGIVSRDADEGYIYPNWSYQSVYEWQQDFAPGVTQVDISYRPLAGYPSDIGDVYETDSDGVYCVDDALRGTIGAYRDQSILYEVQTVGYITTTATYWEGPIGEFHLTIAKEQPNSEYSHVATETSFCGKPEFAESPADFKWTAKDFVPKKDISIVWYSFTDYGSDEESEAIDEPGVLDELSRAQE